MSYPDTDIDTYRGAARIDSRDLIAALADIDERIENCAEDPESYTDPDEDELALAAAIREIEDCTPDWPYGAALIIESDFEDYAREYAEDTGSIDSDAQWPAYCIDWERAASDLAMDFTSVDFLGSSYYVR